MERVVKFRGKCMCSDEWVYGDLIHKRHDRDALMIQDDNGLGSDVVPESVGQFTGLHDKNGKEIYDGDVLFVREWDNVAMRVFDREDREMFSLEECKGVVLLERQMVVYFEEGSMCAGDYYISALWDKQDKRHQYPIFEVEVIGNIHDNPNLLNDGND